MSTGPEARHGRSDVTGEQMLLRDDPGPRPDAEARARPALAAAGSGSKLSPVALPLRSVQAMWRRVPAVIGDPVAMAIIVTTLAGLALRLLFLLHNGFLWSVTEYDDGPYFGSAVRLLQGVLPYRDFVLVQPPGITLLMVPSALLAKVTGTAAGLASGRILTALAGAASVPLMGRLVRHRGALATGLACGLMAVYPDAVAAAHTVLVEPWLVLFCLLGMILIFDGDRLTSGRRRLAWGGVVLGFAGVIEAWAIVPIVILMVMCLAGPQSGWARLNRAWAFTGGVAAGFLVPVAPFAAASPRGFYQSLIVAQIGPRQGFLRVPLLARLYELAGLSDIRVIPDGLRVPVSILFVHGSLPLAAVIWTAVAILVLAVAVVPAFLMLARDRLPTPLGWFALASTWLVVAMFLWPSQFHYHFAAFLAPFLSLAVALPLTSHIAPTAARPVRSERMPLRRMSLRRILGGLTAAAVLLVFAVVQAQTEDGLYPAVPSQVIARADQIIPPGSCVVSDTVALLLLANRFNSDQPHCTVIDDGLGTDLALSHGLTPQTGAGANPAVARLWRTSFEHAQFLWLSYRYGFRIAGSPSLWRYMHRHFRLVYTDDYGDRLYRRIETARGPVLTAAAPAPLLTSLFTFRENYF
jgi:alpha-1,2-mannosyltransferase